MINRQFKLRIPVSRSDHRRGPAQASLWLVEYGDYECTASGRAYRAVKRLQDALPDLWVVFRNFPMPRSHPNAMNAARAAESAALHGRFWDMHDMLFEHQDCLDPDSLLSYAQALRIDAENFLRDVSDARIEQRISSDFEGGLLSGVNATPTFYINGFRYDGDATFEALHETLCRVRDALAFERRKPGGGEQPGMPGVH